MGGGEMTACNTCEGKGRLPWADGKGGYECPTCHGSGETPTQVTAPKRVWWCDEKKSTLQYVCPHTTTQECGLYFLVAEGSWRLRNDFLVLPKEDLHSESGQP